MGSEVLRGDSLLSELNMKICSHRLLLLIYFLLLLATVDIVVSIVETHHNLPPNNEKIAFCIGSGIIRLPSLKFDRIMHLHGIVANASVS